MSRLGTRGRALGLFAVLASLGGLLAFTALRAGPLAPIPVVVAEVSRLAITPELFGTGTVEARYTFKIGPTAPGRLLQLGVQVGDRVRKGQLLGAMAPIDLGDRVSAQGSALRRAEAAVAGAQAALQEAGARKRYAEVQGQRYEALFTDGGLSAEGLAAKRQERQVAQAGHAAALAGLGAARQEQLRLGAELAGLRAQQANLELRSPVDGLVTARDAEPGTAVAAGQSVVALIDPTDLWLHVRFDQARSAGLHPGLPARIVLRSREQPLAGRIAYVEPLADAVAEETLVKVTFAAAPTPRPAIGELAEVMVALGALPPVPVVLNSAVQRVDGVLGVWLLDDRTLRHAPVTLGASDLSGRVQVLTGLSGGERVVTHSLRTLSARSRVDVVPRLPGVGS